MLKIREIKSIKKHTLEKVTPKLTRAKINSRFVALSLDERVVKKYLDSLTTVQLGYYMKLIFYLGDDYIFRDKYGKIITTIPEFEEILGLKGINLKRLIMLFVKKGILRKGHRDLIVEEIPLRKKFYMFNPVLKATGMKYESYMLEIFGKELVEFGIISEEVIKWRY